MARFLTSFFRRLELILPQLFHQRGPPPSALALSGHYESTGPWNKTTQMQNQDDRFSLERLLGDAILWAVPKHRRTVEKRLSRKFGYPDLNWKPLKLKTNLRSCNQCGHDHEAGVLCPHCYDKVRQETKSMQDEIQKELGLDPVDKEVVVLYDGERGRQDSEEWNGKRIVEMKRPRPMWFSKNLMQKTTQPPLSESKEVKPSELG